MWNIIFKRKKMNLFTKQNQTYRCEKQAYVYQREMGGGDKSGAQDEYAHTTIYKVDNKNVL